MCSETLQPTTTKLPMDSDATTMVTATPSISGTTDTATTSDAEVSAAIVAYTTDVYLDLVSTATPPVVKRPIFERLREPYQPEDYNYDFLREM
ncbi:unnamed protein product [Hydatigera taeniaeformis]|uniref:Mediator of RNA polymerase II transcription subunit 31 n=1 Tax=Hydatigena taeniaeformis TaxID=6205 RepID=A0A0R3X9X5_HYDTA|nr:unnamed protein product [Hydatigera taeniaeformis]